MTSPHTPQTFETLLAYFQKVKPIGQGEYEALCPAHNDRTPSLHIKLSDNKILLNCKAGCQTDDILKAVDLKMADLFIDDGVAKPKGTVKETYDYQDKDGKLLFQVVRYEPKGFSQRQPDGKGGWINNLKDIVPVLYHLPDILEAKLAKDIFIVEGEKDADKLREWGIFATCNPMGAGKWREQYTESLTGAKSIIIIADKDEEGRKHANNVALQLKGKVGSIKLIETPDEDTHDISDWFNKGGDADKLFALIAEYPEYTPTPEYSDIPPIDTSKLSYREQIEAESLELLAEYKAGGILKGRADAEKAPKAQPLWGNYFFIGAVTLLIGDPDIGKTTIEYKMMQHLTEGKPFLNISPQRKIIALILDFESADSLVQLRYDSNDPNQYPNLKYINKAGASLDTLERTIYEIHKTYPFNMLFIDNMLTAFHSWDENDNAEASRKIKRIRVMAIELNIATCIAHHPSKSNESGIRKGSGAFAWARHADIVLNMNYVDEQKIKVELETAKNRWASDGRASIYFNKEGDNIFGRCEAPPEEPLIESKVEQVISLLRRHTGSWLRRQLIEYIHSEIEVSTPTIDRAIEKLVKEGTATQPDGSHKEYRIE